MAARRLIEAALSWEAADYGHTGALEADAALVDAVRDLREAAASLDTPPVEAIARL